MTGGYQSENFNVLQPHRAYQWETPSVQQNPSAIWHDRDIQMLDRETLSESNVFDVLSNEIIQDCIIIPFFSPEEALSLRLVNRRFAVLFGDNSICRIYYRSRGLEPPPVELAINLAKQYPLWSRLQKMIDSDLQHIQNSTNTASLHYYIRKKTSLCISVLAIPELSVLHNYADKILREYCRIPKELSLKELMICVAKKDKGFGVSDGARILALQFLSKDAAELQVQQALLSIITRPHRYCCSHGEEEVCLEAVKNLIPYLPDPTIQDAILLGIRRYGALAVKPALDLMITDSAVLHSVIDIFRGGYCGLDAILCQHLNNPSVVDQLVQRLSTELQSLHVVSELAWLLKTVAEQESVQRALCQRLVDLPDDCHAKYVLEGTLHDVRLVEAVKEEYRQRIPLLKMRAEAEDLLTCPIKKNIKQRKQWVRALNSTNIFERKIAASILAPLVPEDPEILDAFLNRIYAKEHGEVGIIIVSALAKAAYRKDVRSVLIHKGPLDGKIDSKSPLEDPKLRLATVYALRPFINEPEVRQALLKRLKSDEGENIRCALIDILAPQLDQQDVFDLFLEAAKDRLCRQHDQSGKEWQIAAIEKLAPFIDRPEVSTVILERFKKSNYSSLKAACIRILGAHHTRLIKPEEILAACMDDSSEVRAEARRVLKLWIQD